MRGIHRHQDGAAATEFALIAPILIVLFFGIVYFGLTIFRQQVIEASAREGARVAAVGGTVDQVRASVYSAAEPAFVTGVGGDVTFVTPWDDCDDFRDTTEVVVTAGGPSVAFTVPFYGDVSPNFSATATFRCEKATPGP